jgi:hypothetical protein
MTPKIRETLHSGTTLIFKKYLVYNFIKHPFIYLCLYSILLDPGRFFSFCIFTQSAVILERGISLSQGRYLHMGHRNTELTQTNIYA